MAVQHYAEVHIGPRVRRCGVKAHVLTSSADTATAPAHFNKRMPFRESPLFFHVKYARRSSLIWTASAMSCKSAPFAEGICPRSGLDACSTNWSKAPVLRMTPAFSICRIFSYLFRFFEPLCGPEGLSVQGIQELPGESGALLLKRLLLFISSGPFEVV